MRLVAADRTTVLYLHGSADLYGADKTLLQLVQGLDEKRFRIVVALPHRGALAAQLEHAGATVEIGSLGVGSRASASLGGMLKLGIEIPKAIRFVRKLVKQYEPQLIHSNTIVVLGGALGAWTTGVPHVWHAHEILPRESLLGRAFAFAVRALSHTVVSNSECTRTSLRGSETPTHRVIHNGVESTEFADSETQCKGARILLVGRINSWKGQALLVEAAAQLRAEYPDATYRIVGDAPPGQAHFETSLDQQVLAANLQGIVERTGFTNDVASEFSTADIVVVPSTRPEPFGLVATEAMAQGVPVIAANHGGLREIVTDHETGRLFEPGSATDLAKKLGELLRDPDEAERLGQNGLARQRSHFTVERYCDEFADLYAELRAA